MGVGIWYDFCFKQNFLWTQKSTKQRSPKTVLHFTLDVPLLESLILYRHLYA